MLRLLALRLATDGIKYVDLEDLPGRVRLLQAGPVRDVGLLDPSARRPRFSAFSGNAYPRVALKRAPRH